ncbi:hypothetical protein LOTGIDRAFT_154710 [Lottia gigantea]|uniref:Uncharacterized protein n=1 Tax=Lottia gigantea TaxID=225164 RepID=V3ZS65_LOTGI|nr:hypothetical protein LOTGIDRAFT_154710 [Lottia gigantea]ESO87207.1 hypothetical protein LOTGIDRAFT_154710 [Lottia gigantea]
MLSWKSLSLFLVLAVVTTSALNEMKLEAEDVATDASYINRFYMRSNASGERTILVRNSQSLYALICIQDQQDFQLADIVYSTDGFSEPLNVYLNDNIIGIFVTHQEQGNGHLWNEFHHTGPVSQEIMLPPGQHNISIVLEQPDPRGAEIDYLLLAFSDSATVDQILCPYHEYSNLPGVGDQTRQAGPV